MVCTETYRRRVLGQEPPGKGLGVRWEGNLIRNRIYNDKPSGSRFIPVLLEGGEPAQIPNPVQGHTNYRISNLDFSDAGFEGLYRHLTGQVPTSPREIGAIQTLSPRPRWVPPDPRNRSRMLEKVRKIWITGFLERSLFHETRILLGLSERPDAVVRSMDLLVQRPDQGERPLPPGMPIVKVFDAMEQLLILGDPGSGKTTLLLELARDLLDRAVRDPTHPIPVVFPLSTWAESRRPLAEWLVEELYQRYDVPRKIGQPWVEADQILPLLDGLDEVKAAHRAACVEAINAFRKAHDLPLVICSRTADYQALAEPLQLYGAIVVQPLSPQQVDSYLTEIGTAGAAVQRAMGHDPMLREMLDSPLMLNIVTVAYAGQPGSQPRLSGTLKEQRDHLFGAYVDQMFRRRSVDRRYTLQRTTHWLAWLASQMVRHSQTVFYIERLQPDWLPGRQRWAFGLIFGLVVGLVFELVFDLVFELFSGGNGALGTGLYFGLFGLFGWLFAINSPGIICVDSIILSWPKKGDLVFWLIFWLGSSLFAVLLIVQNYRQADRLVVGLSVVLFLGMGSVLQPFLLGLSVSEIETSDIPNQGIHRSVWKALVFGLVFGLLGVLFWVLVGGVEVVLFGRVAGGVAGVLSVGLDTGLVGGLTGGLYAGGQAFLKHLALRLLLVRSSSIPWNYVKFLDYTAERILLRKVGGGYIFVHRMLLEHFAARYDESAVKATPNAEPSQRAIEM